MSTAAWVCLTIMFFFGAVIAAGTSTELARIDKSRVDPSVYERCEQAHPFRDDLQKSCRQGADFQSDMPESETPKESVNA
jgi:hypothetical protein